jgi:methylenetetrahydrofolate dehydrogenase (NADP+)/methenyltetrahydrofolate cyclohydrolase
MQLLDGKTLSQQILNNLKKQIISNHLHPTLDIILVGDNPSSVKYTSLKQKTAKSIGISGQIHHFDKDITSQKLIKEIIKINNNPQIDALMIQLPLPQHLNETEIVNYINDQKDADGLTATNLGKLFQNDKNTLISATALGISEILKKYNINFSGKNAVIIGRSFYIGLPLFAMLTNLDATVTVCHSKTKNIKNICQQADILISATGQDNLIDDTFVKEGAVVIDVARDINFTKVASKTSFITPQIGGVGPMTVASLLMNTVKITSR